VGLFFGRGWAVCGQGVEEMVIPMGTYEEMGWHGMGTMGGGNERA
jgi:hypothetical protein